MDRLAEVTEQVAKYSARTRKIRVLAAYLRELPDDDLARAVRFLGGGNKRLSIGYATLRDATIAASGWDAGTVGICGREVGDTGETMALLMTGKSEGQPMTLAEAEAIYTALSRARKTAEKVELLRRTLVLHRPGALKYFLKIITGNLRIGLQAKMVEEAVAEATGVPHEEIRAANNRSGNLAEIALHARRGSVHTIEAELFHPMDFMLARPLDTLDDLNDPANWLVEDKYDGIRAQVHADGGRVLIYTRGMEDATASFPEVVDALKTLPAAVVLDGEILAWRDGRALPFNVLQQRIARKKLAQAMLHQIPVSFMAYDLLFHQGRLLLDTPIEERRRLLDQVPLMGQFLLSPQLSAATTDEVDRMFTEARERGNEGLVIKRRGSLYEPGRRSGTWQKIKRPYGTLDVVITAAEQGHGRRATVLSDYTFAVRDGNRYLNVGKAYSGLTDEVIRELTRLLRAATKDRFGRVYLVEPAIVLEVAFDNVQTSPRHKSGFALRFPRIVRWRRDKQPAEADTLDRVKELYEASLR